VRLMDYQSSTLEGDYSVDDIFLALAEFLARRLVEKGTLSASDEPFYYTIEARPDAVTAAPRDLFPDAAYAVDGGFHLPQPAGDRERTVLRKVKEPPLPVRDTLSFGETHLLRDWHGDGDGLVFMHTTVYHALKETIVLSDSVENGGYLIGLPYRNVGSAE